MKIITVGEESAVALSALHATAFEKAWSPPEISQLLATPAAFAILAYRDDQGEPPIGFVLAWAPGTEAEILTLAVAPGARRIGAAAALVSAAVVAAMLRGAEAMYLEVSESNVAARALYAKLGFEETGRRRGYYESAAGSPDALVLRRATPRPSL